MQTVHFTSALKRFFPDIEPQHVEGQTVAEVLDRLETQYPGLKSYLVTENGALRKHINIFVDGDLISDRDTLTDQLGKSQDILIFQALSGG
jgi:molybdopterin synthase sulfur carrier subunit